MSRSGYRINPQTNSTKDSLQSKHSASHPITQNLDALIQRLSDKTLPNQPYLLSVPSDKTNSDARGFANSWCVGSLFGFGEGQLQYLSFLPHLDEDEGLLKAEGEWWNESGDMVAHEPSPGTAPPSGRNTPLDPGQRKKISLKDYKTKDKTAPASLHPDSAARSVKSSLVRNARDDKKTPSKDVVQSSTPQKSNRIPGVAGAQIDGQRSPRQIRDPTQDAPRPEKRRKLSPPTEDRSRSPFPAVDTDRNSRGRLMPKLLSPTLPSPEHGGKIPDLLLPDLPPSLLKALSASLVGNSAGSDTPSKKVESGNEDSVRSKDKIHYADEVSHAKSPAKLSPANRVAEKSPSRAQTSTQNGVRASPGPRQRHTIILKFSKKNRKRFEALVKLAARPKKTLVQPEAHSTSNGLLSVPGAKDSIKVDRLHSRDNSVGPPAAKRPKTTNGAISEVLKRPSTPLSATPHTPSTTGGASKPQTHSVYSTPHKAAKTVAMKRVESVEGADALTPPASHKTRLATPDIDRTSGLAKTSPNRIAAPVSKDDDRQMWSSMNTKYFALGRSIKHEGTASDAEKDSARSIVLLIEALLCFMINIAAQSHLRPNADPGWNTIIPYHIYVFRASRKFPHLHGLVIQLGAICRQFIQKHDMDRLARDPLPDDQYHSAPTPGSDGHTKTTEDMERYKRIYLEFRDGLVNNTRELQTAWLDGLRRLSVDILEREYPETWAKRCKDSTLRGVEKIVPSSISRNYYLPLDPTTTVFEATHMTLAFLKEWVRKEKVDWETRIDL